MNPTPPTRSNQVQKRLIVPLMIVLIFLLISFSFIIIKLINNNHSKENQGLLEAALSTFEHELMSQSDSLAALAKIIARDSQLREDLSASNRQGLFSANKDVFEQLKREHHITHFYFHQPNLVNLLRVHNPDRHSDQIKRFTALTAKQTNVISSGIELGPLGTFTLRTVMPVWDAGQLIGFLELGKEIEDILAKIHEKKGTEIAVTITKKLLNRNKWQVGMEMLGRPSEWNRFAKDVLIYHSQETYPKAFEPFTIIAEDSQNEIIQVKLEDQVWHRLSSPLRDVSGAKVGRLIIWYDHTDQHAFMSNLFIKIGLIVLAVLSLLFVYVWFILRQTDKVLLTQQATLVDNQNQLEKAYHDLKLSQSKLLQSAKMASVGKLAAGVAHEINNPMGFISQNLRTLTKYMEKLSGFIIVQKKALEQSSGHDIDTLKGLEKKLKLDYLLEDSKDLIQESLDGSDRVQAIVKNLKTFSRVDQNDFQTINVNDCLDNTINLIENEVKHKIQIRKDFAELPKLSCLPQQLGQAFMNLLINATDAIKTEGVIHVRSWADEENIYAEITDNGCGISAENVEHIFEPFFTTKDVGKGTGLGLSMVYDIIKGHQGEITVNSKPDLGTTFTVRLPINKVSN